MSGNSRRKQKINIKGLIRVFGAAVLIVLVILAIAFVIGGKYSTQTGGNSEESQNVLDVNADSVSDILPFSSGIAVVTDNSVKYFDSAGNVINENKHTYASPVAVSSGKNILLYDHGGYRLRIEKNANVYNEVEFKSVITCASIGKKGNYAYVLNSEDGFQSHLYVFSARGKKQYEWGSASGYISCLTLADNGRSCAVNTLSSENAELCSEITMFDFSSDTPVYSLQLPGVMVYGMCFIGGKNLIVICDSGVFSIDKNGEKTDIQTFSSSEIKHFNLNARGLKAVSAALYGNDKNTMLTVFSSRGKTLFEQSFLSEITFVSCSERYTAVLLHDTLEIFGKDGKKTGTVKLSESCSHITVSGRKVYAVGNNGVYAVDIGIGRNTQSQYGDETLLSDILSAEETAPSESVVHVDEKSTVPSDE